MKKRYKVVIDRGVKKDVAFISFEKGKIVDCTDFPQPYYVRIFRSHHSDKAYIYYLEMINENAEYLVAEVYADQAFVCDTIGWRKKEGCIEIFEL